MEKMEKTIETRPDQVPPLFAALGIKKNTMFPVVDEDGNPSSNFTRDYIEKFTNRFPNQKGDLHLLVGMIETIIGTGLENIEGLVKESSKNAQIITKIREKIFSLAPMQIEGIFDLPERSKKILLDDIEHALAEQADEFIEGIVKNTFQQQTHTLSLKEEVKNCNNSAKLLIMVLDEDLDPRVRFEARRKLAFMYYFAKLKTTRAQEHYDEKLDHKEGLEWLMHVINRQMSPICVGEVGKSETYVIDSVHNPKDNMAAIQELTKIRPKRGAEDFNKKNGKRTEVEMRTTKLETATGEPISFHISSRDKTNASILDKNIRSGEEIGTGHTEKDDRSGIRFMLKTKEEWEIFYKGLKNAINTEVNKEISKTLERLRTEDDTQALILMEDIENGVYKDCVKELKTREKGSIEGGIVGGTSRASAGFKGFKIDVEVVKPDENGERKKHTFEIQAFLPHNFVDYLSELGHTWEEYNINRVFYPVSVDTKDKKGIIEYCSMVELLFPKEIYKGIDYEKLREESIKRVIGAIWPDLDKEIAVRPLRKEEPRKKEEKKNPAKKGEGVSAYRAQHAGNKGGAKKRKDIKPLLGKNMHNE